MEVKPGNIITEVEVIPDDWNFEYIENFAHITTGSKNTQDRVEDGKYPFFVRSQNVERINSFSFDGEAVLTAGDGVGTGKVFHYINGKFDVHQRVYRISDFAERINGFFFYLYFSTHFYNRIMQMTAKSSVDSVRRNMIAKMQVPVPPTEAEQRAISVALGDVNSLLHMLEKLISKRRDLKQAAMQQLLTGKTRLPGFKAEWKATQLGYTGSFLKGIGIKKNEVASDGLPCIRYGEIYTHHNDHLKAFNSFITPETAKRSQRIQKGDLLFAGSGETAEEIGKCVAFLGDEEAYAGGDIIIFRPFEQDSKFLGYLMNDSSVANQKSQMGQGEVVVHISSKNLARLELFLPSPPEQTAIAGVLSDMDAELAALEQRRTKTDALKQGMMQELLTGRTRLV
jgi:type I restriction enzyme S subunit